MDNPPVVVSIAEQFARMNEKLPYLGMERLFGYLSCFGGFEKEMEFDYFEDLEKSVERIFVDEYHRTRALISPTYILEAPYRDILMAIAGGDGRMMSVFRKTGIGETVGGKIVNTLEKAGIVCVESSREVVPRRVGKMHLKKEFRGYRAQPKIRFVSPFVRFWFAFVEPDAKNLHRGLGERFMKRYITHRDRVESLIFEQLSDALLRSRLSSSDPVVDSGAFWEKKNEFDIYCFTKSGKVILGECKFKGRRICLGELAKLQEKARQSGLSPDIYAFFSRSGFSGEMLEEKSDRLLLFGMDDFRELL